MQQCDIDMFLRLQDLVKRVSVNKKKSKKLFSAMSQDFSELAVSFGQYFQKNQIFER